MRFIDKSLFILAIISISGSVLAQAGSSGSTGLAFLKIGVGARASAMGEAFSAVGEDATATYWNPASLGASRVTNVIFAHTSWLQDITHDFLAAAFPVMGGRMGVSFYSLNIDGLQRRTKASSEPVGTFQANNVAAGLSYGRRLGGQLGAGISAKFLYEKTFTESASGYAFDFGVTYSARELPATLALVVQNVGSMGKLRLESSKLPVLVRLGGAVKTEIPGLEGQLILSVEAARVVDADTWYSGGAELLIRRHVFVRLGYQSGIDDKGLGTGFGLQMGRYHFDYGFTPFSSDLGNVQRFSFALDL